MRIRFMAVLALCACSVAACSSAHTSQQPAKQSKSPATTQTVDTNTESVMTLTDWAHQYWHDFADTNQQLQAVAMQLSSDDPDTSACTELVSRAKKALSDPLPPNARLQGQLEALYGAAQLSGTECSKGDFPTAVAEAAAATQHLTNIAHIMVSLGLLPTPH